MAFLLDSLREAGADEQAAALADRAAAHVAVDDLRGVDLLLDRLLREAGAHEQAAALAARVAAHAAIDQPGRVARLLNSLRSAGAERAFEHPGAVAFLLARLREAGADEQAAALVDRAVAHVALDDPDRVARLLAACGRRARTSRPPRCWPATPPPTPPSTTRTTWPACWTAC